MSGQLHASRCCMVVWVLQSRMAVSVGVYGQDTGCIAFDIGCVGVVQDAEGELLKPPILSQELGCDAENGKWKIENGLDRNGWKLKFSFHL